MGAFRDITGQTFGRLQVLSVSGQNSAGEYMWSCVCACGNRLRVRGADLRNGHTTSCSCAQKEITAEREFKHGHAGSSTYSSYNAMLNRCYNDGQINFVNYGGRGIRVCRRWRGENGFERFIADMGVRPDGMTLERLNPNKNYNPTNCTWANKKEQANNRRTNVFLTHEGRTLTMMQWSEELGIKYTTIRARVRKGWSVADALSGAS